MLRRTHTFRLAVILFAFALSLSAWAATSALGAFEWKIGPEGESSSLEELGLTEESVGTSLASGTEMVFKGTVLGIQVELEAKALEGVGTKIIKGGTDSGKLKLSELTLTKPAGCSAPASITTAALNTALIEVGGVLYDKFTPVTGTSLAVITLTGTCAIAETPFKVTVPEGKFLAAEVEPVGVQLVSWPLRFSPAINSAAGGTLEAGGNPATLTGTALMKLTGGKAGKAMGGGVKVKTTRLCKKLESPCAAGETYAEKTELEGKGKSVIELTIAAVPPVKVTITCTEAGITALSGKPPGEPRLGLTLSAISFGKCTAAPGGGACEVSGKAALAHTIEYVKNGNGLWNFLAKLRLKCPLPAPQNEVFCELVEGTPALAVTGGNPATVAGNKNLLTRIVGGANCPSVVEWTPSYSMNKPKPLFVAE